MPAPEVDTGKLIALRYVQGLTYDEIGKLAGITGSAVYQRLDRYTAMFEDADTQGAYQTHESAILAGVRAKLLAHAAKDENIEKLSSYAAIGSYGLLFDKQRILDGKSTANIAVLSRLIDNTQETGDSSLRKLSIDPPKANNTKRRESQTGDNPSTDE